MRTLFVLILKQHEKQVEFMFSSLRLHMYTIWEKPTNSVLIQYFRESLKTKKLQRKERKRGREKNPNDDFMHS